MEKKKKKKKGEEKRKKIRFPIIRLIPKFVLNLKLASFLACNYWKHKTLKDCKHVELRTLEGEIKIG